MVTTDVERWLADAFAEHEAGNRVQFAVRHDGTLAGSTSYLSLGPEHRASRSAGRGSTRAWGTGANVEAKSCYSRTRSRRSDAGASSSRPTRSNERSRGALAALGAEFEGIHRKHMLVRGGEHRDSAWYAILDDDWPQVRARLRSGSTARARDARPRSARSAVPGIPQGTGATRCSRRVHVIGAGRVGSAVSARPRRAGRRRWAGGRLSSCCSAFRTARSRRSAAIGRRGRGSRTSAERRRSPRSTRTRAASALHPLQTFMRWRGAGAARRRLGGDHRPRPTRRASRHAGSRRTLGLRPFDLDDDARRRLSRGRRDRVELPRHAAPRRGALLEAAGAPPEALDPADGPDGRERLRADRPDRARRLGDGRRAPRGDPRRAARAGADVPRAGGRRR